MRTLNQHTTEKRSRSLGFWIMALAMIAPLLLTRDVRAIVIDRIVATVNGDVITLLDLYKAEAPVFGKILLPDQYNIKSPQDRAMERELLNNLIEERLLLQRAKEKGISFSTAEVDAAIGNILKDKNLTEEMMAQALTLRGLTMVDYRDRIGKQITISKLITSEARFRAAITPQDVSAYYQKHLQEYTTSERVKIRHLLVLKDGPDDQEARARIDKAAAALAAGADFQQVAEEYSQDSSLQKGQISGYIQRGDTLPELEAVMFSLQTGQVSPVIESKAGFHLLKIESRDTTSTRSLEESTPEITNKLMEEKYSSSFKAFIEELKRDSAIDIKL
jgi:peptidyl-prolyl cis-trans isomerase SurA